MLLIGVFKQDMLGIYRICHGVIMLDKECWFGNTFKKTTLIAFARNSWAQSFVEKSHRAPKFSFVSPDIWLSILLLLTELLSTLGILSLEANLSPFEDLS